MSKENYFSTHFSFDKIQRNGKLLTFKEKFKFKEMLSTFNTILMVIGFEKNPHIFRKQEIHTKATLDLTLGLTTQK